MKPTNADLGKSPAARSHDPLIWNSLWQALQPLGRLVASCILALAGTVVFGILVLHQPFALVLAIWQGAWASVGSVAVTIAKTPPLLLTGLAVAVAYRGGLLNIGCEGQLTLGALAAAGFAVHGAALPPIVLLPCTLVAGALIGGLWALPALWLRQRRGVHEVISTLLLNYVAIYLAEYLVRGPLGDGTSMARTPILPPQATLSPLLELGTLGVTAAPFLALSLAILAQGWFSWTLWGFEATAVGSNRTAASRAGIDAGRWRARLFLVSGGLAGFAGALEVVAVHHRFYAAFSPGYGFDGIAVAFLVNGSPGWLWLSSLLLATLRSADKWLQLALNISPNAILMLVAILLLVVACRPGSIGVVPGVLRRRLLEWRGSSPHTTGEDS